MKEGTEALTGDEQSILRSELWELMRISRIARPGAIYDASSANRTCDGGKIGDSRKWNCGRFRSRRKKRIAGGEIGSDSKHMPGYQKFLSKIKSNANKVNL